MAVKDVNGQKVFYISKKEQEYLDKVRLVKEKSKAYPAEWIYTINYFGAKRSARKEYEILYRYLCSHYKLHILADAFGGTGTLSLIGAKTGLFDEIYLNELSYLTINYHYVMKNDVKKINPKSIDWYKRWLQENNIPLNGYQRDLFQEFLYYLNKINEDQFKSIRSSYKDFTFRLKPKTVKLKSGKKKKVTVYVPKRIQVRYADVRRAVLFYLMQFYAMRADGEYDEKNTENDLDVEVPKEPRDYINELRRTHELYKKITLSQKYYKKFIKSYLDNSEALILLDPPYMEGVRVHTKSYVFELTDRQHRYLLQELTKQIYPSKIVLCGYSSYMYHHYFLLFNRKNGDIWHCIKMKKRKNTVLDKEKRKTEYVWVNFEVSNLIKNNRQYFEEVSMESAIKDILEERKREKSLKNATIKKEDL